MGRWQLRMVKRNRQKEVRTNHRRDGVFSPHNTHFSWLANFTLRIFGERCKLELSTRTSLLKIFDLFFPKQRGKRGSGWGEVSFM